MELKGGWVGLSAELVGLYAGLAPETLVNRF